MSSLVLRGFLLDGQTVCAGVRPVACCQRVVAKMEREERGEERKDALLGRTPVSAVRQSFDRGLPGSNAAHAGRQAIERGLIYTDYTMQ